VPTETLTVYRGGTDKLGNKNRAEHGTIQGVFAWGQGTSTSNYSDIGDFKGEATNFTAQVFVKRGTDLKNRDRVKRANGDEYRVIGDVSWDQLQPQTGHDFGWAVFQMEAM
jgi:hypothetical protein